MTMKLVGVCKYHITSEPRVVHHYQTEDKVKDESKERINQRQELCNTSRIFIAIKKAKAAKCH